MTLPIVVRPEAQADLLESRDWYQRRRPGLGDEFAAVVEEFLRAIAAAPETHAKAFQEVRRGKLRRFPFVVYYRVLVGRVEILAVLHGSRSPRTWQSRV